MSIRYLCDGGCGAWTNDPEQFIKFGIAKTTRYCGECASAVAKVEADMDKLHDRCADIWAKGLTAIRDNWHMRHDGGALPDA